MSTAEIIDLVCSSSSDESSEGEPLKSEKGAVFNDESTSVRKELLTSKKIVELSDDEEDHHYHHNHHNHHNHHSKESATPHGGNITLGSIDTPFELSAAQRTALLVYIFPSCKMNALDSFRKKFEKGKNLRLASLWALIEGCFKEMRVIADLKKENPSFAAPHLCMSDHIKSRIGEIFLCGDVVAYAIMRLTKMIEQQTFDRESALDGEDDDYGRDIDGDANNANSPNSANSATINSKERPKMYCSICCFQYHFEDGIFCNPCSTSFNSTALKNQQQHWSCKACTKQYISKTPKAQNASITSIPCFSNDCPNLLPPALCKKFIGPLNTLNFEESDHERSRRVALGGAGGKKIYCETCRETVGIILQEDLKSGTFSNNKVPCPKCSGLFCVRCGNKEHDGHPCRADREVESALGKSAAKNTKRCPNCGATITKNGGCNHMSCPPPSQGGCGHQFCWLCGGNWPKCDCGAADKATSDLINNLSGGGHSRGDGWVRSRGGYPSLGILDLGASLEMAKHLFGVGMGNREFNNYGDYGDYGDYDDEFVAELPRKKKNKKNKRSKRNTPPPLLGSSRGKSSNSNGNGSGNGNGSRNGNSNGSSNGNDGSDRYFASLREGQRLGKL